MYLRCHIRHVGFTILNIESVISPSNLLPNFNMSLPESQNYNSILSSTVSLSGWPGAPGTYKYNSNVFLLFHAPPLAGEDPVSRDQILRTARAPGM
jgi:hypothetical protein